MNVARWRMRGVAAVTSLLLLSCGVADSELNQEGRFGFPGWVAAIEAGDYSFFQYDKGKLQGDFLEQVFKNQEEDYLYYQESVEAIETEFRQILTATFDYGGLKWMSDMASVSADGSGPGADSDPDKLFMAGQPFVKGEAFAAALNRYAKQKLALQTVINTKTSISAGALPSYQTKAVDGAEIPDLPPLAQQNFAAVREFYNGKLAEIDLLLQNLPHKIMVQNAPIIFAPGEGKGLTLPHSSYQLTAEQVKNLQTEILLRKLWNRDQKQTLQAFGTYTRHLVQNFVDLYGRSERYRFETEGQKEEFQRTVDEIEKVFFARSYFRFAYGMPMGAFNIRYDKKWANFDVFAARTAALDQFAEEMAFGDRDLQSATQNMRLTLQRAEVRAQKILDGDLNFFQSIESGLTFLGGYRPTARAAQQILRLVAKDVYEERLISQAGGLEQMGTIYRSLYEKDKDTYLKYLRIRADIDWSGVGEREREIVTSQFPDFVPSGGLGRGTLPGQFQAVAQAGQLKFQQLAEAEAMEATLAANEFNNQFRQRQRGRFGRGADRFNFDD